MKDAVLFLFPKRLDLPTAYNGQASIGRVLFSEDTNGIGMGFIERIVSRDALALFEKERLIVQPLDVSRLPPSSNTYRLRVELKSPLAELSGPFSVDVYGIDPVLFRLVMPSL